MNIVFLSPYAAKPLYGGAVVRIHHLVSGLARRHDLVWACRAPQDPQAPCPTVLNSPPRWLQIFNPLYAWRVWQVARQADLLIVSSLVSGVHALAVGSLCRVPMVYDAHNVEHLLLRRLGSPWWGLMALLEGLLCRRARAIWTVSETDAGLLHSTLGIPSDKVRVVPNGVDMTAVQVPAVDRAALGAATDELLLLFFGVLSYAPNAQAVRIIQAELVPRLDRRGVAYRVVIAGLGARPRVEGRIRWLGFVDNLYGVVKAADVVIVPLTTGSGTRMKILEAIACGTPVVSTPIGAEGLEVEDMLLAEDWDTFVEAILTASQRPATPPSPNFVAQYAWEHIVDRISL